MRTAGYLAILLAAASGAAYGQADFEGIWLPVDPLHAHPADGEFEYMPAGQAAFRMVAGTLKTAYR